MKTILFLLITWTVLASCSTRKYASYFHLRPYRSDTYLTKAVVPLSVKNESLVASTSKVTGVQVGTPKMYDRNTKLSLLKVNRDFGKGKPAVLASDTLKKESVESVKKRDKKKEGDKEKNGFAVAGFALSFSPIVGALIAAFLSPGTGVGIVIGALGFFTALVLCFIGKKSERRRLAKAGLWIMIVETILLIFGIIVAIGITQSIN